MGAKVRVFLRNLVASLALLAIGSAVAEPILGGSFHKNIANGPIGPFSTTEDVVIVATLWNRSIDQTATICPGICVGDANTFSLGGLAGGGSGQYTFFFGNDPGSTPDGFDGQTVGSLAPGEERDFIFGVYRPNAFIAPGTIGFFTQLQIFEATANRPYVGGSQFGGTWQVRESVPEPATLALVGLALGGLALSRRQRLHLMQQAAQ